MYNFDYQRPQTRHDATEAYDKADDGLYLAGGQTILTVMKQRLARPEVVIDLGDIEELKEIRVGETEIFIGAMTTHAEVASNNDIIRHLPALADLAGRIGDPHVRNRGTLGGSIANNDPAADYPAAVLALGATIQTTRRQIEADDFFTELFETALEEGELITGVRFPIAEKAAYIKIQNPASRFAIVGVFVARFTGAVRLAVTGAAPCVFRLSSAEEKLTENFSNAALETLEINAAPLNSDIHASAEYRAHLVGIAARRAVRCACEGGTR